MEGGPHSRGGSAARRRRRRDAGETLYLIYVTWREKRGSFRGDQGKDRLMVPNYRTTELAPPHAEWNLVIPLT